MNTSQLQNSIKRAANDLAGFKRFELIIASICILIPLFLIWADNGLIRRSISNYVYMRNSHIFGMLLAVAAMLFIVNGVIYIKMQGLRECKQQGKWYNIILGAALLGVVLFPHLQYPIPHYISAIIFFGGSAVVIALFNDKEHQKISWTIAILSLVSLFICSFNALAFVIPGTGWLSLFWAEWISLTVIAIHYMLESLGELT